MDYYYLVLKRDWLFNHEKTRKNLKYTLKEANLKGYILFDSNCDILGKTQLWTQ